MRTFSDILDDVLDRMDVSVCVTTVTDLGSNLWRLNICDCGTTLHAVAGRKIYSPTSVEYTIVSIVHDTSITITSVTSVATGDWTLPRPAFRHGTPIEISAEIAQCQTDINRMPLVWMLEVTKEDRTGAYDPCSIIEVVPDAIIYVLDFADFRNGTVDTLHEYNVRPMSNFADRMISEGRALGIWEKPSRAVMIPWSKFGLNYTSAKTADRFSAIAGLLPDHCGGVELRISVPCLKQN